MVLKPPRTVEYICLSCGAQGSTHREATSGDESKRGGSPLKCPKCGGPVLYLEREAASEFEAPAPVEKL